MRTPNTACLLCGKPLYRRPNEMARTRYAACMAHRSEAQKVAGITGRQHDGLKRGRVKGTNHRIGYRHREESKRKTADTHRRFWAENPDKLAARGEKLRGEQHYCWKGGVSKLNESIRRMTENRRWMEAVKARDGKCIRCGSISALEAHHIKPLADLVTELGVTSRDDARKHAVAIWDLSNGETLCGDCHYAEHGRNGKANKRPTIFKECQRCGITFTVRPSIAASRNRRFCSWGCRYADR